MWGNDPQQLRVPPSRQPASVFASARLHTTYSGITEPKSGAPSSEFEMEVSAHCPITGTIPAWPHVLLHGQIVRMYSPPSAGGQVVVVVL